MIIKMYSIFARETLQQMEFEGKLAAQAGHAYLHAWWDAEERLKYFQPEDKYGDVPPKRLSNYWYNVMEPYKNGNDARKVSLVVDTVYELEDLYEQFRGHMGATLVEDCGYTVFSEPTITAVGLGPVLNDWAKGSILSNIPTLQNEIHNVD